MTCRELPRAEWDRIRHIPPFHLGLPESDEHWKILVVEDGDTIVGCVSLHTQVHFDPWWIDPERKTNPAIVRELVRGGVETLRRLGIPHIFATIDDGHTLTQAVAEHAGFMEANGKLYLAETEKLGEI